MQSQTLAGILILKDPAVHSGFQKYTPKDTLSFPGFGGENEESSESEVTAGDIHPLQQAIY